MTFREPDADPRVRWAKSTGPEKGAEPGDGREARPTVPAADAVRGDDKPPKAFSEGASAEGCPDGDGCEAVILAAGYSSRAGAFKMGLDFGGKTLLQRNVEVFLDARRPDGGALVSRVVVVVGHCHDLVVELLRGYERVVPVKNPDYGRGMYSSVLRGVAALSPEAGRFFLCPGDYPLLDPGVCEALAAGSGTTPGEGGPGLAERVSVPVYRGRQGHPLLLDARLVPALLAGGPDGRLDRVLAAFEKRRVDCDSEGILLDLDSPEDYARLRELFHRREAGRTSGEFRPTRLLAGGSHDSENLAASSARDCRGNPAAAQGPVAAASGSEPTVQASRGGEELQQKPGSRPAGDPAPQKRGRAGEKRREGGQNPTRPT